VEKDQTLRTGMISINYETITFHQSQ
jgi:hypothetical protein